MEKLSLEAKKAYFAKQRRSNYTASLRLEGFKVSSDVGSPQLPTRKAALETIRKLKA
ncbi:YhfG family protein [Pusillimonas sp.]|uniref:YhfG family protein n=1 Tax=Pusillimonas sp. TaxID=3040095 RepID=UPI00299FDF8C|nr:YhfG family protein [Pusillimonas sp.]MDX3895931.1 YhfG family protein [Pusillimonas sp.]